MKFYTLLALVVSAAAIRVTQVSTPVPHQHSLMKGVKHILSRTAQDGCDEIEAWFEKEVNSDDGLTWDEFKAKITELCAEHGYTPTESDWEQLKEAFDSVDTD